MSTELEWNEGIEKLIRKLTSFNDSNPNCTKKICYHFMVKNQLIGYIRPNVLKILRQFYGKYFIFNDENKLVMFETVYDLDYNSRTDVLDEVLKHMKEKELFLCLKGWRDEKYNISELFYGEKLFKIERSACCIFGFISYGYHINGYVKENGSYMIWLARRSPSKQTFPGMLDNLAAGGFAADLKLFECAVKELDEESDINGELLKTLKPVDAVSYAYEDDVGIVREGEFVFDIKLPASFVPKNKDGEAESFYLMNVDEIKKAVIRDDFKPNCALITINFLIRKGIITPDNDRNYFYLLENMHKSGF